MTISTTIKVTFESDSPPYTIIHGSLSEANGYPGRCIQGIASTIESYVQIRVNLPAPSTVTNAKLDWWHLQSGFNSSVGVALWRNGESEAAWTNIAEEYGNNGWCTKDSHPIYVNNIDYVTFYAGANWNNGGRPGPATLQERIDNCVVTYSPSGPDESSNSGEPFCPINVGGEKSIANPIGIRNGEKREEVTDFVLNTPTGRLAFTRVYRQGKRNAGLGLGWTHTHDIYLDKIAGTPARIIAKLPTGGEAHYEATTPATHYEGKAGIPSTVDDDGASLTLTGMDHSTFIFEQDSGADTNHYRLRTRQWPNGEKWRYSYNTTSGNTMAAPGKVTSVDDVDATDNPRRQLVFRYHSGGAFAGLLYRVGDQTFNDANPDASTGRYVQFSYTPGKQVDETDSIVTSTNVADMLLTRVRDVRGQPWTYTYYGQDTANDTDKQLLNWLTGRQSPTVDNTGDGAVDTALALERDTYTVNGTEKAINGNMEVDSGWSAIGGTTTLVASPVHSGTKSRQVVAGSGQGIQSSLFEVRTGRLYVVTAWVYLNSTTTVTMKLSDALNEGTSTSTFGAWKLLRLVYSPREKITNCTLQFTASGAITFYVDDVSVQELRVSTMTQRLGQALPIRILNGDMESSSDWTAVGGATANRVASPTYPAYTGTHAWRVAAAADGQGVQSGNWNLVAGRTYMIAAQVYAASGTARMQVPGHLAFNRLSLANSLWETLQAVYTAPSNAGPLTLQFVASGGAATFYVDNVVVLEADWTASAGKVTNYAFQPGGQNITTEMTAYRTTTHQFNNGTYEGTQDPAGNYTAQAINPSYRPTQQIDANGNVTNLSWNANGKLLNQVKDALLNTTAFTYDTADRLLNSTDAQSRQTTYIYGDSNNPRLPTVIKVLDVNGTTVLRWQKFEYDTAGKGRLLKEQVVDPANGTTVQQEVTRTYYSSGNGNGLLNTVTQKDIGGTNNTTTTYTYDSAGRVTKTQQSAMFGSCDIAYTVYDPAGNVLASICNYDPGMGADPTTAAQAVALFNPSFPDKNRVTTHEYDTLGRRIRTTTNAGASYAQTTLTVYDALNRVIRTISNYVTNPSIPHPYTAAHSAFTHGTDNNQNLVTDTVYNQRGLVRKQVDVLGNVTLHGYDDADRLVKVVQSASQPNYDNDYSGDPDLSDYVAATTPDQDIVTASAYDSAGNLVKSVDAIGNVTFTVYDALNRPLKTVHNAKDSATVNLDAGDSGYVAANDPRTADYTPSADADRDLITRTEYDSMGRVVQSIDVDGRVTRTVYDALGRVSKTILNYVAQGTTDPKDWHWNGANWQRSSTDTTAIVHGADNDQNSISLTAYDDKGSVLYTQDILGRRTWNRYDGLGRVVRTVANASGSATDGGTNDPRSDSYAGSTDADKDRITITTYDLNGRVQWAQEKSPADAVGRKTWYVYDTLGRMVKTIVNCTYTSGSPAPEDANYVGSSNPDEDIITRTEYDAQGRVFKTFDAAGKETRYTYDGLGRRTKIVTHYATGTSTDADKDLTQTFLYDLAGRVTSTTDARGTATTFTYDAVGRQKMVTQAANVAGLATQTYTCFDKVGRVLRVIQNYRPAAGDPSPDAKDTNGNWLFAPGAHGLLNDQNLITTYTLDRLGRQVAVTNPENDPMQMTYAKDGTLKATTDPEGAVTQHRYDGLRRRKIVVAGYAAGSFTDPATWVWDDAVGQKRWEDGAGAAITFGANNDRNIIARAKYDKAGRMLELRDPRGNVTAYGYDLLDRRTTLTNPLSHTWTTQYAEVTGGKRQHTLTNPLSHQTRHAFDRLGRMQAIQYLSESPKLTPDVTFTYDKVGNRLKMSEAAGGPTPVRETHYGYDGARRLTSVGDDKDGNGTIDQTVSYQYDKGGLRTTLTMPGSLSVSYTYDAKGQLVSLTDWSSQQTRYGYDNLGRLVLAERSNRLASQYQYDAAGRLRRLRHARDNQTFADFAYTVDKRGNRAQAYECVAKAGTGATTVLHDSLTVEYYRGAWTVVGNLRETTVFTGALRLAFFGKEATLTLGKGPDHSICDVYIDGKLWQSLDGYAANASEATYTLTLAEEGPHLLDIRNRAERNVASSGYKLRFKSLVTAATTRLYDLHTIRYAYDALSRVRDARYYPGTNTALPDTSLVRRYQYTFDVAGNRTQETLTVSGTPTTVNFIFDAANRLVSDSVQLAHTWDEAGRMTNEGGYARTWDRADRMASYQVAGTQYQYNGLGQRVRRTDFAGIHHDYLLDVQPALWHILSITPSNDTTLTRPVHGPQGTEAQQRSSSWGSTWDWILQDGLGSVRVVLNDALTPVDTRQYAPYGDRFGQSGSATSYYGFTGAFTDETNVPNLHLRARYYNWRLGVFPSLDPLQTVNGAVDELGWMNGYNYANGNPVNLTDHSGLYSCSSEAANIQSACAELDQALQRGRRTRLEYQTISNTVQQGMVLLRDLETATEQTFGAQLTLRLPDSVTGQSGLNIDIDNCSTAPDVQVSGLPGSALNLTKQSLLRTVAAMIHIASRFSETGIPTASVKQWLSRDTVEFLSDSVNITGAYTGYVQLDPPTNIINLGSQVTVGTIVHELGHSFDRAYDMRPSSPLGGLYLLRDTGQPTYDSGASGFPNSVQNGNGMFERASQQTFKEEVWADMFMTWVLDGQNVGAVVGSGNVVGWDRAFSRDARFKRLYTLLTVKHLSSGLNGIPAASATEAEKLRWVRYVTDWAFPPLS